MNYFCCVCEGPTGGRAWCSDYCKENDPIFKETRLTDDVFAFTEEEREQAAIYQPEDDPRWTIKSFSFSA